jgi:hypothetical protein
VPQWLVWRHFPVVLILELGSPVQRFASEGRFAQLRLEQLLPVWGFALLLRKQLSWQGLLLL